MFGTSLGEVVWNVTEFIGIVNLCANPFVYAAKMDDVRHNLRKMLPCSTVGVTQPV